MRVATIKPVLVFAVLAALAGPALTQERLLLGQGSGGDALSMSVLDGTGATRTVRIRLTYAEPRTIADVKNVLASASVEQIDCQKRTHTVTRYELYTSADTAAAPAWSSDISSADAKPVAVDLDTESASAVVFRAVCLAQRSANLPLKPAPATLPKIVAQAPERAAVPVPESLAPPPVQPKPVAAKPAGTANQLRNNPQPPVNILPEQQPAAVPANARDSSSTIADHRPFPESSFTLGIMGRLAEYVYLDQATLNFDEAVFDKIERGRERVAQDGKQHPLLDEAYRRLSKRVQDYSDNMRAKEAFLFQNQLKLMPLPKLSQSPIDTFRAELYQYLPTSETILVFRGTQAALDWVSNLWTGVDLLAIEAPHYRAAYDLVAALRKQHINPIVVGHSLGGGMAQYVGYQFGLKVVGFNSAPLPERYYTNGAGANAQYIRLFSAVETVMRAGGTAPKGYPDLVSISLANGATYINELFPAYKPVKAHQHLVKPICVRTSPDPLYTPNEQQMFRSLLNAALTKGVVSAAVGGVLPKVGPIAADKAMVNSIRAKIESDLSDPIWQPDKRPNVDNKRVAAEAKNAVAQVAIDQYKTLGGATSIAKGSYKVAFGNSMGDMFAGLGTFAGMAGKTIAVNYAVTNWLLPHSMARFNRGMLSVANRDVFQANPERAPCETATTTY